jgi:hypothetical protein
MVKRLTWIEHEGKEILLLDAEGAGRDEQLAAIDDYVKAVKGRPAGSVLLLMKGSNIEFHPEVLTRAKAAFNDHRERVRKSAVVGMHGVLKMAVQGYREAGEIMGRDMQDKAKPFDKEEDALDWLTQD